MLTRPSHLSSRTKTGFDMLSHLLSCVLSFNHLHISSNLSLVFTKREARQLTHLHQPLLCVYKSNQSGRESESTREDGEAVVSFWIWIFSEPKFQRLFLDSDPGREVVSRWLPNCLSYSLLFVTQKVKKDENKGDMTRVVLTFSYCRSRGESHDVVVF